MTSRRRYEWRHKLTSYDIRKALVPLIFLFSLQFFEAIHRPDSLLITIPYQALIPRKIAAWTRGFERKKYGEASKTWWMVLTTATAEFLFLFCFIMNSKKSFFQRIFFFFFFLNSHNFLSSSHPPCDIASMTFITLQKMKN